MSYIGWYLLIGFVGALIFACSFTKTLFLRRLLDTDESEIVITLKLGLLFLINILIWPISLFIFILSAWGYIFGKKAVTSN